MTEGEARASLGVSRETLAKLERLVELVIVANADQNLIAASTVPHIWARHIADSAQLLQYAPSTGGWLDLGSGPGFPGLVVALITERPVTLVESRARRVAFLYDAVAALGLGTQVEIIGERLERIPARSFAVISARAFAPLDRLLPAALPFSTPSNAVAVAEGAWGRNGTGGDRGFVAR